jgi:CheY-like chemotaxis protein
VYHLSGANCKERVDVPSDGQKWILIVDDERKVAFFLEETLKALGKGLSVVSVGSAEEALEQVSRRPFDLVVTDLRMPGMDGLELMQRLRNSHPEMHTILITAYGSEEVEAEVRRLYPSSYLTKPFPAAEFTQAVERALQPGQQRVVLSRSPSGRTEAVRRVLATLRQGTGARCALLVDTEGQVVAQAGTAEGLSLGTILPILVEEVSVTSRVDRRLEGGAEVSLHHYEGKRYQIYAAVATDTPFLLVALSSQASPRRSGVIWLFLRRTLQELRECLWTREAGQPSALAN